MAKNFCLGDCVLMLLTQIEKDREEKEEKRKTGKQRAT
jgi:hypothetical protein